MIITRTPLRVSLVGGGTDFPSFYRNYGGAVLSFAINKYVYVTVNEKFDGKTRLSYSLTETVDDPKELRHDIAREILKHFMESGLEVTTVADVPSYGTGLGSSSAFTVGLIKALTARRGERFPPKLLAETAYMVEATLCGHSVGKQDQYAAAFGNLHFYEFAEHISVEPILLECEQKKYLESRLMLFHLDKIRNSNAILESVESNLLFYSKSVKIASKLRDLAYELRNEIVEKGNLEELGRYLHRGWKLKKLMSDKVSDVQIDRIYSSALHAGAQGGKLCGAGGGGFFLFFVPPEKHEAVRIALGLRQMQFRIEPHGCEVIYDSAKIENSLC